MKLQDADKRVITYDTPIRAIDGKMHYFVAIVDDRYVVTQRASSLIYGIMPVSQFTGMIVARGD